MAEPGTAPSWSIDTLAHWLGDTLGVGKLSIETVERLGGGAIQENWLLTVGLATGTERWVLRTSAPRSLCVSHDRSEEYQLLVLAHRSGLQVPDPIIECSDTTVIGKGFCIMQWCAGTAQARRLVRDAELPVWGAAVVRDVATDLARLHALPIAEVQTSLPFLTPPEQDTPVNRRLGELRRCLDEIPEPHPVLEYLLNWLQANQPASQQWALLHGDCRTGNLLVHDGRLSALLDWEFADFGDPREDLGWFTAPCWRFGNDDLAAGGLASDTDLLDAYEAAGGASMNPEALDYWQILAELRWAVIALLQAERCYTGGERSLELALTDRLVPDLEAGLLQRVADIDGVTGMTGIDAADGERLLAGEAVGQPVTVDGAEFRLRQLVATARDALVETLTPGLSGERKYTAALLRRAFDVVDEELSGVHRLWRTRVLGELTRQGLVGTGDTWSSLASALRQGGSVDPRFLQVFLTFGPAMQRNRR